MDYRAIAGTGRNLSLTRRAARNLFRPPTADEVHQTISDLRYFFRILPSFSLTINEEPIGMETLSISQPTIEIGEQSLLTSGPTEILEQNLSTLQPTTDIATQSSLSTQSTVVTNLPLMTPTTMPPMFMSTLTTSTLSDSPGQRLVGHLVDEDVWSSYTTNSSFLAMFGLEPLLEGENAQAVADSDGDSESNDDDSLREGGTNTTLHSEPGDSHIPLGSDSNTGDEGVQGSTDSRLMKAFKMFLRIMGSISGLSDVLSAVRATGTAQAAPVTQPTPSGNFGTGTAQPAPPPTGSTDNNRGQPDDNRTRFEDPQTERKRFLLSVATVVVFIILKRIAVLLI